MKKVILLVLILVFVSGCTGREVKIDSTNGLIIDTFSADPVAAEYNDLVFFDLYVENVGGTTAESGTVYLYGIENIWRPSNNAPDDTDLVGSTPDMDLGIMDPPDPTINRPGDFKTFTKSFYPPILPEGVVTNFPVTARIVFSYSTTGSITIPAYSESLYRIKMKEGDIVDTTPKVTNTFAPIQIALPRSTELIIDDKLEGEEDVTFEIKFVNVGDGWPVTDKGTRIGGMTGTIKLFGPGVSFDDCLGEDSGTEITIDEDDIDLTTLRSNGEVPIGCSIKIDRDDWGITTSGSIVFTIDMEYDYYVEETVNVKVYGTKDLEAAAEPGEEDEEEEEEDVPVIDLLDPEEDEWLIDDFDLRVKIRGDPDKKLELDTCEYKVWLDNDMGWQPIKEESTNEKCEGKEEGIFAVTIKMERLEEYGVAEGKNRALIVVKAENEENEETQESYQFTVDYTNPHLGIIEHEAGTDKYEIDVYDEGSGIDTDPDKKSCRFWTNKEGYTTAIPMSINPTGTSTKAKACQSKDDECKASITGISITGNFIVTVECTDIAGNKERRVRTISES